MRSDFNPTGFFDNFIFDDPIRNIIELLCWVHTRRKFYDARQTSPELSHSHPYRHGLNVFTYLKDIIARINDHPANQLHELLPDKWTPNQ